MKNSYILSDYLTAALEDAKYEKLEESSYGGRISSCPGVVAFAPTLAECKRELRSVLEDWVLLGLKMGHRLPVIHGIDLNRKPQHEPLEPVQA